MCFIRLHRFTTNQLLFHPLTAIIVFYDRHHSPSQEAVVCLLETAASCINPYRDEKNSFSG